MSYRIEEERESDKVGVVKVKYYVVDKGGRRAGPFDDLQSATHAKEALEKLLQQQKTTKGYER